MCNILNCVCYLCVGGLVNVLYAKNLNNITLSAIGVVNDKQLRGLVKIVQAFRGLNQNIAQRG